MKKTLLTLGSIASVATPMIAVVSCGSTETKVKTYADYNMSSINEVLKSGDADKFKGLIVPSNKEITFIAFKNKVAEAHMSAPHALMVNQIMEHYKDQDGKITTGWYVLNFAIQTLDPGNLNLAMGGWKGKDGDDSDAKLKGVTDYILKGTIHIDEIAQSIIDKFAGKEAGLFNMQALSFSLTMDVANHIINENFAASTAYSAMGGKETFAYIMDHGTGSHWTFKASAGLPAGLLGASA